MKIGKRKIILGGIIVILFISVAIGLYYYNDSQRYEQVPKYENGLKFE